MGPHGLKVVWTDHRGVDWDLTTGDKGVILDVGQGGMSWPEMSHAHVRGGQVRTSTVLKRAEHHFKVTVGWDRTGTDYYRLRDQWWGAANSPWAEGTLTVTRPDGETRWRKLHLLDTPDTEYPFDPGLGYEPPVELWSLTGDYPWWWGDPEVEKFAPGQAKSETPFYGPDDHGWPLYIGSTLGAAGLEMTNRGQGPMWLDWTLVGPLSSPSFGVADGVLNFRGDVPAGEHVVVRTSPAQRGAWASDGTNLYDEVSGTFAPIKAGQASALTMRAEGVSGASLIQATGTPGFAMPF